MAYIIILACAVFSVLSGAVAQNRYVPDTDVVYHLFTRNNPTVSEPMLYGWPTLIAGNFSNERRTILIFHGWDSGATSPFNTALVPAILNAADVNLIAVDWSAGASEPDNDVLINDNVPSTAYGVGRFILWFNLWTGARLDQYHIIGFEIGSHLGGYVGRLLGGLVPFVTALNPPRQGWDESNMFTPTDGLVTEAIHTDVYGSGMLEPVAQMDFYPNGGLTQPGCHLLEWECSRDRAFLYFAESIVTGGFTGIKCETTDDVLSGNCDSTSNATLPMGGLSNKAGNTGLYYVSVNEVPPYSTG